jgi:hypothetical protein
VAVAARFFNLSVTGQLNLFRCTRPAVVKNAGRKEMDFFCDQFWFCEAMPPEWHWVMPLGMPLLLIIIVAVPVANILHRAGRSRWWTILAFLPLVNLIGLWVFAFTRWPNRMLAVGPRV